MSNIKRINNGYGISIKFPTSSDQILFKTTSSGKVYASYQPTVKNISLNDSMNYTFSSAGLGGVSLFNNNSLFDKMQELKKIFNYIKKATNCCFLSLQQIVAYNKSIKDL